MDMELPKIIILDENDTLLRKVSSDVIFPLLPVEKKLINDALLYLKMSQIDDTREKFSLRAGMGLAFIQLGIPKRIFVICEDLQNGEFKNYVVINPKIISSSEELIYVEEGEGCLSVNRIVEGIVIRNARVTIRAYDVDGKEFHARVREDIAVAFQHEIDHLNGILFTDKIDSNNPYKDAETIRGI